MLISWFQAKNKTKETKQNNNNQKTKKKNPATYLNPLFVLVAGCDVPAEIVFMLHGSRATTDESWKDSQRFLSRMVNNMYVGPSSHHYGLLVYGRSIGDHVGLQPYKDKFTLQNYFNSLIKPTAAGSNVGEGLCYSLFLREG
jgi:hypothetical protein